MAAVRFRQRRVRRWWYLGMTLVVAAAFTVFMVGGAGAVGGTVLANSPSNFESGDGNMTLETSGNTDWNCFQGTDSFGTLSGTHIPSGCKVTSGATALTADPNGEVEWVNGQKFDTQCPLLSTGNNPPKDEFTHIAQYLEIATTGPAAGDLFFYGGAERSTNNGNASGDVEFNQLTAVVPGCPTSDGTTSAGARTLGDRLVAYDFKGGGTTLEFHILTWITCASSTLACGTAGGNVGTCIVKTDSPPCWGLNAIIPVAGAAFNGESNQLPIDPADNAIGGDAQAVNQFAEFGVDLTLALTGKHASEGGVLPCFPQQVWESRSSASSFTSNPQDIEFQHASTCGSITIIKHTLNGAGNRTGVNQNFTYSTTGGLSPSTFTLNDATGSDVTCPPVAPATTCNTQQYKDQSIGTYTVTEDPAPANFAFKSLTCSGGTTNISGQTVTITLAPNDNVVCTYVNQQQLGAIKITKTSSKAAATPLANATFSITSGGTPISGSPFTTDVNGTICVQGLVFGDYVVTETAAPSGYAIDNPNGVTVTVDHVASCSSGTPNAPPTFTDTPLTDLTITASSEAPGGTQSTITCTNDATSLGIGNSPQGPAGSATVTANGLKPGNYTCKVVVDP